MKNKAKANTGKDFIKGIIVLSIMLGSLNLFSQTNFNVRVIDPNGQPAANVNVTFEDVQNHICLFAITDSQGRTTFQGHQIPNIFFVYDTRNTPSYGAATMLINQSRTEYTITVPFAPRNQREVASQINNIYEQVRTAYGYYSTADFIEKASRGIQATGSSGLGVPGLFSISILPKFENGKPMMELSGKLAEFIFGIYHNTLRQVGTIAGNDAAFQLNMGRQGF